MTNREKIAKSNELLDEVSKATARLREHESTYPANGDLSFDDPYWTKHSELGRAVGTAHHRWENFRQDAFGGS